MTDPFAAFDMFVFDAAYAAANQNATRLRSETRDAGTGEGVLLWNHTVYEIEKQGIRVVAWTDRLAADGTAAARRYCRMDFSWVTPDQVRTLLAAAGFEIEHAYGGFERAPLTEKSTFQIWTARRR